MPGSMTEAPWRTAVTRARRAAPVVAAAAVLPIGALAACAPGGEPTEPEQETAIDECPSGAVAIGPSASDLQQALDDAQPGSAIRLADTTYAGRFTVTVSGSDAAPITLCGSAAAVIDGGSNDDGYTLHLDGASHWALRGFTVAGAVARF